MSPLRTLLLLAAGSLAACSAAPATPQDACRAAANDDPAVKLLIMKAVGNPHAQIEDSEKLAAAKQDAFNRCLRDRGLQRRGGVERQRAE